MLWLTLLARCLCVLCVCVLTGSWAHVVGIQSKTHFVHTWVGGGFGRCIMGFSWNG